MSEPSFFARLWMAWICFFQIIFRPAFARAILPAYHDLREGLPLPAGTPQPVAAKTAPPPAPKAPPPEEVHRSALFLLSMLQREGRFVDFLQEEVAPFSDAEVGAAARIVHEGCRKVVRQYVQVSPVRTEGEGASVTVPAGFDAHRIRLTGNVQGQPPYSGTLKHPGWEVKQVSLPPPPESVDPKILAAAEVELA